MAKLKQASSSRLHLTSSTLVRGSFLVSRMSPLIALPVSITATNWSVATYTFTDQHRSANKKKYLCQIECVAPLRHWLDWPGSGPELSPKHAPSHSFCWEVFWRTGSRYRVWRRRASFTVRRFVIWQFVGLGRQTAKGRHWDYASNSCLAPRK